MREGMPPATEVAPLAPVLGTMQLSFEPPSRRLEQVGIAALSDAEVIALVLGGRVSLAEELLKTYGSLRVLRQATSADLTRHFGIGPIRAAALQGALELGSRVIAEQFQFGTQIKSPTDGAELLKARIGHLAHEEFWVIVLDTKNRVQTSFCLYRGTVDSTSIRVPEVFREAIRRNSPAIIIGHNHPSNDVRPSPEDLLLTRGLVDAARALDISLLDHLIVGSDRYCSLRADGRVAF